MKPYQKILLAAALVLAVGGGCAAHRIHSVQKSYYPMAGEVTIADKSESGDEYYIVIDDATGEQFTLSCSAKEYASVQIGDTVNCERHQSIVTHEGKVHKIAPLD